MRIVRTKEDLPGMFQAASTEALNAFSNGDLYMEKFIENAPATSRVPGSCRRAWQRHVAGQERECSIQRRHQKLIEEAPSLQITQKQRDEMGKVIKRSLKDIGYWNAGTIEFLMDEDGQIYFIEMNTRIQVEHCVTEMVTGVDLVKAQLRIASGEKLDDIVPDVPKITGHAIECRINAEHPEKFTPSPGKITVYNVPGGNGVRVDTAQYAEGVVPQYYDSLIAKLACHGKDREEAMNKMQRALSQFVVEGIHTTIPSCTRRFLPDEEFRLTASSIRSLWNAFWESGRKNSKRLELMLLRVFVKALL